MKIIKFKKQKQEDVFIENNPYGYHVNINHPEVKPYYERFKKWKGIRIGAPSDAERLEFEQYMIQYWRKKGMH